MKISTKDGLTDRQAALFFAAPESVAQRQYEALRAFFVDQLPSAEVAERFAYTPGSFRVLCHQFRHDADKRQAFFAKPRTGPDHPPLRDLVRERVVALRKQYLSVYDIQRQLAAEGQAISIHSLTVLLREEGFARLPRRRDDERPAVTRPDVAAAADVRLLDGSPRTFRTRLGGLFVFVPLMRDLCLPDVVRAARLPGTQMIPAEQAVRTLLALKLMGKERKSHVMNLVADEGIALFAGLNVVPKRSYLAAYSSSIAERAIERFMAAWFNETPHAGLTHGASLDLDFHTVPTNSTQEPLEKHYVSRRSRSQQGMLTFLARDAEQRVLCYAHAGIAKADQANEIIRFVDYWQRHTGAAPAELVFDSKLTTYAQLAELHRRKIHFITLRRRTRKMLGAIYSRPASAWQRITLPALTRLFRTPKVLDEHVTLKGYAGSLRQMTVVDLGHEEPTILLTNNDAITPTALVTRYAQRMLIENGIAEAVQFFHLDALSSMVGLKVDFDLQITLMASTLYRLLAERIGAGYDHAQAKTLFGNLLDVGATVAIEPNRVVVTLDKRAHNPFLIQSGLADTPTPMPWFDNRSLHLEFG
jgi:Transposase DDE domain